MGYGDLAGIRDKRFFGTAGPARMDGFGASGEAQPPGALDQTCAQRASVLSGAFFCRKRWSAQFTS